MPKKKKVVTPEAEATVAEAVGTVTHTHVTEEVLETRNGFTLCRKGEGFSVKNPLGEVIAPWGERAEAEQLFRNMSRKF
jgi:hypothetical protein